MSYFTDYRQHSGANLEGLFKTTLFQSKRLLLGMDCLAPGQTLSSRTHAARDKFFYVIEGRGLFTIGEETQELGPGEVAWTPAGVIHTVVNTGAERLVMLIGMAPRPGRNE